ncbi:uncharacterized protein LOC134965923 isoform X2 [Pseudophryne corroboree]|uniref:uncharacterized protein LOC134965923 isoform X2 n=1 Tax=Pseudophryne corroboree TaxID=495146 RepID=UPI00308160DD
MPGNLNEGDCTLTMTDARREDSGQYIFRFEESPTSRIKYNYENSLISVNITGPPTTIITREINDCGNVDSKIIAGIVAGNVIILILISLGIFCFVKRYMEKKLLGNGRNKREETEPTYQDLKGQNDIYSIINTQ